VNGSPFLSSRFPQKSEPGYVFKDGEVNVFVYAFRREILRLLKQVFANLEDGRVDIDE
jgi:hypothetical protein